LEKLIEKFLSNKKYIYLAIVAIVFVVALILLLCTVPSKNNNNKDNITETSSTNLQMDKVDRIDASCSVMGVENYIEANSSITLDLNSDGTNDVVNFYCKKDKNTSWADGSHPVIEINGTHFILEGSFFHIADSVSTASDSQEFFFNGVPENSFYLIDLDQKDSFIEIAISFENENGYPQTNFYRYDGSNISKSGQLFTLLRSGKFDYNGNITCCAPLIEVIKWFGDVEYTLNSDGTFTKINKYYEGKRDCDTSAAESADYLTINIKNFLFAYTEPDDSLEAVILEAQPITLIGSDEANWIKCKTADGSIYWFKCSLITESDQAFLNDMGTAPFEIFEGEAVISQ